MGLREKEADGGAADERAEDLAGNQFPLTLCGVLVRSAPGYEAVLLGHMV
jgi:hypothetical protein